MNTIRVALVDDHAILREGLRALLTYYDDIEVVGEAADGDQALALVEETHPDIVIMDIAMPTMSGIEATGRVLERFPDVRVLILTQHDNWRYVVELMRAGASGYVMKRSVGSELITALRAVAGGETFIDPVMASTVVRELSAHDGVGAGGPTALTARERQILALIGDGKSGPQIAAQLFLSLKTISWHRTNIMAKLDLHSTAALVRYALENGLVYDVR